MNWKNVSKFTWWAILGLFVGWVMFGQSKIEVDVEAYQTQINLLQLKIDSVQELNIQLKQEAEVLNTKIVEYDSKINNLNSRIYVIKKETEKRLNDVDLFGDDELEQFFADRYRHNTDSVN